jgi:hypothetical protein
MTTRLPVFWVFIGTNGTGKTTMIKRLITGRKRVLIVPPNKFDPAWDHVQEIKITPLIKKATNDTEDDAENFFSRNDKETRAQQNYFRTLLSFELNHYVGVRKIYCPHPEVFKSIIHGEKGFINGTLVIDDFKNNIQGSNLTGSVRSLLSDRRHKMLDIFAATHGCNDVPPTMLNFGVKIWLFKTTGNFDRASENFLDYDKINATQKRVNDKAKTNPYYFEIIETNNG